MLAFLRSVCRSGVVAAIFAAVIAFTLHPACVRYCVAVAVSLVGVWWLIRLGWRSEVERKYAALFAEQGERIKGLGAALEKAGIHKPFVQPTMDLKIEMPKVGEAVTNG